jgi:tetratricopeptide (TPR) repeat protein
MKTSSDSKFVISYYLFLGLAYEANVNMDTVGAATSPADAANLATLRKAIQVYSEGIAIIPRLAPPQNSALKNIYGNIYSARGVMYLHNKLPGQVVSEDAAKAVKDLDAAISWNPGNAQYYLLRGLGYNQLLKSEAAWEDFKKAHALDPSNPEIRNAYEKQRALSPEGQEELRRELDAIRNGK